eukprot:scaffold192_cov320-Ochromonas_danica.AAC.38
MREWQETRSSKNARFVQLNKNSVHCFIPIFHFYQFLCGLLSCGRMAEEQVEAVDAMDRAMALAGQRLDRVAHLTHQVISQHSSLDLLKLILSEKVVADTSSYLNYFVQTKHGLEPALSAAVVGQNPAIIRRLLQEGVDVNIVNAQGYTSLIHAALLGDEATVRLLLEVGADPSLYFAHRMKIVTPLGAAMRHCAKPSQSRHTNMMRHILMSGANLQTTLEEESEAMEALIEHGHIWAALENMAVEKEDKVTFHFFERFLKWRGRTESLLNGGRLE